MQLRVSASFGKIYLRNDYCCKKTQQNSCMKLVTVYFFKGRSTPRNLSIFILFLHPSNFLRLLFFVFYKLNSKLSSILILRPVIGFMANFKILFFAYFWTFILCLQYDKSSSKLILCHITKMVQLSGLRWRIMFGSF